MPTLKRRWTAADLADLPDDGNRYEVIDGELLVTPAPSFRHQEAVGALYRILRSVPSDPRVEVMSDRLSWHPEGAGAPLEIDVASYFSRVLDT